MKKLLILMLFIAVINTGCVKSLLSPVSASSTLPAGTMFILNGNITLDDLKKPDGQIPTEPFTITSVCGGNATDEGSLRYWATSANGLVYNIPVSDFRVVGSVQPAGTGNTSDK
jgi:hypothetical protein